MDNPAKIALRLGRRLAFLWRSAVRGIALYFYLKNNKMDFWLFLDSIAPAALIGQALARPANFINQELYGQPTKLLWGIPIDAEHRLAQFSDLSRFPVESTRFHPTFAYEMILNIISGIVVALDRPSILGEDEARRDLCGLVGLCRAGTCFH